MENFKKKNKENPHKHMVFIWGVRAGERLSSEADFMASGKTGRLNRNYSRATALGFQRH